MDAIQTGELLLIPSDQTLARAEADRRGDFFRRLDVQPPVNWPPELSDENTIAFNLQKLAMGGDAAEGWWCWYFVREVDGARQLVGNGGFKGPPDEEGQVEIGYSILPEHRGQGLATAAVVALCEWAAGQGARSAVIHTLPDLQASIAVARKAGFDGPHKGQSPGAVLMRCDLTAGNQSPSRADRGQQA